MALYCRGCKALMDQLSGVMQRAAHDASQAKHDAAHVIRERPCPECAAKDAELAAIRAKARGIGERAIILCDAWSADAGFDPCNNDNYCWIKDALRELGLGPEGGKADVT